MKRRDFLKYSSLTGSAVMLSGLPVQVLGRPLALHALLQNAPKDKILVLIQLNGGNDGLNMISPLDQYATLFRLRQNIMLPEKEILRFNDATGLHPKMTGLHTLYKEGKVGVVQSVGYPKPNLSHFRATDIWTTASDSNEVLTTGWLGRYLNTINTGYPVGYPNSDTPDPLAITIGNVVSNTCQGYVSNMGLAIPSLNSFVQLSEEDEGELPNNPYGNELKYLRQSILQTNLYLKSVQQAASKGRSRADLYPADSTNRLSKQLKVIAQLISGGLQTQVYVANLGGFDTHANQVPLNGAKTDGSHADLLKIISDAVYSFQRDLEAMGIADKVVGMTFSEFGRRITSNASYGTDHGTAAPLIVFGNAVNPILHGQNPVFSSDMGPDDNLPMQFDFRSVYSSILQDWLGADSALIKEVLFDDFQYLPIIKATATSGENDLAGRVSLSNYPNPFVDSTRIRVEMQRPERVKISVFNSLGQEIDVLTNRLLGMGIHEIPYEAQYLSQGYYYCRLQAGDQVRITRLEKRS